ncbi:hypothetical protein FHU10_0601 [Serratia fonticola]|uniref:Uncharacterized protein n=1 Tax=Serratia fonticola TaxID=47917 RepID=A0A542D6E5_SERFO|nr:hypothetical protein FHU09_1848 [Serratia fonticola]TQI98650.1 hypothetical protein FHU11_4200 [Serratia fonticola]TVZ68177.1 hypothetical protein FHU10_0601 [Serratia fonticola]
MKIKSWIVMKFLSFTHSWNHEIHRQIENKVSASYNKTFPGGIEDPEKRDKIFKGMRDFYYQRMMNTATMLLAICTLIISLVALIVSMLSILR